MKKYQFVYSDTLKWNKLTGIVQIVIINDKYTCYKMYRTKYVN
jgi:hypothetical protein